MAISSYDAHNKKIGDLFVDNYQNNKYPELTNDCKTLHNYYKEKVARDFQNVYYVYGSTETTSSNLGKYIECDASSNGISYAVLSTDDSLYKQMQIC